MLKAKLIEEEPLKINLNVNYTTTKAEPAEGVLCLKGTVDTFESLPTENKAGDVYLVGTESPYNEYLWTGEAWEALSPKPEPMPDYVERSELTHATESIKTELAGELSKVSELAPKSELETLKSDFETKLAGVSELVEKLKESGGEGSSGAGGLDESAIRSSRLYQEYESSSTGIAMYLQALSAYVSKLAPYIANQAGESVPAFVSEPHPDPIGLYGYGYFRQMNPVKLIKTEKGYRLETFVYKSIRDASGMAKLQETKDGFNSPYGAPHGFFDDAYKSRVSENFINLIYELNPPILA